MDTPTDTTEVITSGKFTITKDLKSYWIKIVATSKTYRDGQRVIYKRPFTREPSLERRLAATDRFVKNFLQEEADREQQKTAIHLARKEARKSLKNPFNAGNILYHSWGYDQTNIDFYQVTAVKRATVKVRPVA